MKGGQMAREFRGNRGGQSTPFDLATFAWVLGYCGVIQSESAPIYINEEALSVKEENG
jgi:hypothetical protein